jgi:hypothetical protein
MVHSKSIHLIESSYQSSGDGTTRYQLWEVLPRGHVLFADVASQRLRRKFEEILRDEYSIVSIKREYIPDELSKGTT